MSLMSVRCNYGVPYLLRGAYDVFGDVAVFLSLARLLQRKGERFAVTHKNSFSGLVVVAEDRIKQIGKKWLELRIYLSDESSVPGNSLLKVL